MEEKKLLSGVDQTQRVKYVEDLLHKLYIFATHWAQSIVSQSFSAFLLIKTLYLFRPKMIHVTNHDMYSAVVDENKIDTTTMMVMMLLGLVYGAGE